MSYAKARRLWRRAFGIIESMIRTRDFLLFVVVFVFILSGIVVTVASDIKSERPKTEKQLPLAATEGSELSAATSTKEIDRARNLMALREKILRGEGEIIQGAPVFTSVDTPPEAPKEEVIPEDIVGARSAQYCAQRSYSATALLWGSTRASLRSAEGVRLVILPKRISETSGSSTVTKMIEATVLQLPLYPIELASPACLDSEYVGVALDGSLINNDEAWRYRNYSPDSVIGYARDGFPIYGPGVDEDTLDACGGFNEGAGYRYHIRQNELFVLGCFAGVPASFIES